MVLRVRGSTLELVSEKVIFWPAGRDVASRRRWSRLLADILVSLTRVAWKPAPFDILVDTTSASSIPPGLAG